MVSCFKIFFSIAIQKFLENVFFFFFNFVIITIFAEASLENFLMFSKKREKINVLIKQIQCNLLNSIYRSYSAAYTFSWIKEKIRNLDLVFKCKIRSSQYTSKWWTVQLRKNNRFCIFLGFLIFQSYIQLVILFRTFPNKLQIHFVYVPML